MNADGTNIRRLTDAEKDSCHPSWSPESSRIARVSNTSSDSDIYTMNADGSDKINLTGNQK